MIASPCEWVDLPQSYMEPILVKYVTGYGFQVRFSTELVGVKREAGGRFLCTLRDDITRAEYQVRAKYVFGADGGRSKVARDLGFPFTESPSLGRAINVLLRADLDHLMASGVRQAQLHTVVQANSQTKLGRFGGAPIMRLIRPWTQWLLVCMSPPVAGPKGPFDGLTPQSPELLDYVRELIGDDSVHVDIERVDPWVLREVVAERFSSADNDAFLLGDAAHRHPPCLGLGSNT